jgi:CBS domain-containing protein
MQPLCDDLTKTLGWPWAREGGSPVKDKAIETQALISIREGVSIKQAAELMSDLCIGALAINDAEQKFVGLLTERDLLWAAGCGKDPFETRVVEVMNDFPVIVEGPITSKEAARRMTSSHIRHLIVREDDELRVVGMRDVMRELVDDEMALAEHAASLSEMRRWFNLKTT